jgi:hypothetical protein
MFGSDVRDFGALSQEGHNPRGGCAKLYVEVQSTLHLIRLNRQVRNRRTLEAH